MIKVAICDDEKIIVEEIKKVVENHLIQKDISCQISIFADGANLWKTYEIGQDYDLIFLDINMNEMNGIDLGKKIRGNLTLENNQIVYISSERTRTEEMLDTRAFGFIFKDDKFREKIRETLTKYIEIKKYNKEFVEVVDKYEDKIKILLKDVKYFQSQFKKIYLYTLDTKYLVRKTLKELENILPKTNFIRINSSNIINGDKVKNYQYKEIIMKDGKSFKISQTYQVKARQYFLSRKG